MNRLALIATFMTLSAASIPVASAYEFYIADDSDAPLRWFRKSLEYRLATTSPAEFAAAELPNLASQAFEAWVGTACGKVPEVGFMGTSSAAQATKPTRLSDPPDNIIVFIASSSKWSTPIEQGGLGNRPEWIAITKISHNTFTGEIVDADIEVNDGGYKFSIDGTPGTDEIDFLAMLTHEVGHYFGLDHSAESDATMYASYSRSPDKATEARTLSADDEAGICALYTDVPESPHEQVDDGDSGNGCATGSGGSLVFGLLMLARLRRRSPSAPPGPTSS
ncbi:MAG: matrixin family metalloprotease [Deltaproteobacteria bacterium]|nr:matrixin family metalloprotease [Deltaproteobacteria bacterium]